MGKRGIGIAAMILTLLLLALGCQGALAEYEKAIIDAPSGKLHLREEASANSASLGLFFTGTQVELRSGVENGWVKVKIGRERGYMMMKYLKTGAAANRVEPKFWNGTVRANQYARMRKGPSTEYEFIRNVNNGENLKIMGETDENWYYVKYKGEKGFISANLIYTSGKFTSSLREDDVYVPVPTRAPVSGWRQSYREYIQKHADSGDTFSLIYVNDDDIPELVIDSGVEAEGCRILTYASGQVSVLTTRRLGFTYIARENLLCNSDGSQDHYFDDVYEIRDGRWRCLARGEYYGYQSGWNEAIGRYVCRYYVWNGQYTTIDQYLIKLSQLYNEQRAVSVEYGQSYSAMLSML